MDKDTINVNAQDSLSLSSTVSSSFTRSSFYIARDSGVVRIFEDGGRGRKGGGGWFSLKNIFLRSKTIFFQKVVWRGEGGVGLEIHPFSPL